MEENQNNNQNQNQSEDKNKNAKRFKKNLDTLLKMKDEYPNVKFHAYHVQPDGSIKKHNESN